MACMEQTISCQAKSCFQADNSKWSQFEFLHLLAAGVRSVVGGDCVDSAVGKPLKNCVTIFAAAQRRFHFVIAVVIFDVLVNEAEVMRRNLASDCQAMFLSAPDHFERACCGKMRNMEASASLRGEKDVPRHHHVL